MLKDDLRFGVDERLTPDDEPGNESDTCERERREHERMTDCHAETEQGELRRHAEVREDRDRPRVMVGLACRSVGAAQPSLDEPLDQTILPAIEEPVDPPEGRRVP